MREDVVQIARDLLGKIIYTETEAGISSGRIVETEAYKGAEDKASHAWNNRRTARTETMFMPGGHAYVYLCYGIHHLFNVVTAPEGIPHAVLIRGIEPLEGVDLMLRRRNLQKLKSGFTYGPGTASQALGIHTGWDRCSLSQGPVCLLDDGFVYPDEDIESAPRIGIDYAEEHALLPWRFFIKRRAR